MTKLKEYFTAEDGIFNIFENDFSNEFSILFPNKTATELNILTLWKYGNKFFAADFTEVSNVVLHNIIKVNLDRWLQMQAVINTNVLPTANEIETKTKTGTLQTNVSRENSNINADKVFNSTDFISNEKNDFTESNDKTDTYNLTETTQKAGNIIENVKNAFVLRETTNLQAQIIYEIVKQITIDIY